MDVSAEGRSIVSEVQHVDGRPGDDAVPSMPPPYDTMLKISDQKNK